MKRQAFEKLIFVVAISLANYWIWRVFSHSYLLALGLVLLSIFLAFRLKFLTIIIFIIMSIFLIKNNFDTNLKYISPLENDRLVHRYEYYAEVLGKLYRNRVGLYFHYKLSPYVFKYQTNLSYNLDPNLYFFANHPRERGGGIEFAKFPGIFLPVFIIGMIFLLSEGFSFLVFYFIVAELVSAFIFSGYDLGPILIFPFVVTVIFLGLSKVFRRKYEV